MLAMLMVLKSLPLRKLRAISAKMVMNRLGPIISSRHFISLLFHLLSLDLFLILYFRLYFANVL
jgi:hypothetical protein